MISKLGQEPELIEVTAPFNKWFDESGYLVARPLQELLASSVPLIGRRDPKRVKSSSQAMLDSNPELLDAVMNAGAVANASGTDASQRNLPSKR